MADVVNAAWYFAEGDNLMGSLSLISALPVVGSFLGNGAKVVAKTTKVASKGGKVVNRVNKAGDVVKNGTKLVSHSTDLTTTAIDIGYGVSDLHQEIKSGNIDWKTAGGLALNVGLALVAGHGSIKSGNGLRKALNNSGSGTVTAHTSSSIKNTGSPEVSDNKARVQAQVGGSEGRNRTQKELNLQFFANSNSTSWARNLNRTSEINTNDFLFLQNKGVVRVNSSGSNRPLTSTPNSYYHTGNGEHVFIYDNDGKLIYDISNQRVKGFKINVDPNGNEHYQAYKLEGAVPEEIKEFFGW